MPSPLPNFDEAVWQQFEHFVAGLRGTFHRSDQFQRFRAYLRALLEPCERKNIESLAASASSVMAVEANLPQAFQHFVSQSPWNPDRLLEATRANQERSPNADSTVWVVHDAVFSKKGKHSVGVQRQFARSEGKKLNCQIGVVVAQWNAEEYLPLACRLYIPTTWLKENEETARRSIPEEYRRGSSKGEIALELLDRLKAELQVAPTFIAEEGYHGTHAFVEGLAQRSWTLAPNGHARLGRSLERFEWLKEHLGLDHFEGRTWQGWHHHVALVFVAYGFLVSRKLT
jgi:SRSO17 transposase